jgi:Tetratricopeptide repeat
VVLDAVRADEYNLLQALDLAHAAELWDAAVGCLQGLRILYEQTGRAGEWALLVAAITPDVIDPATGDPLPGRELEWNIVTGYRARLAREARDWISATALQNALIAKLREQTAAVLAAPPKDLTPDQRNQIRSLGVSVGDLGTILLLQRDPGCLPHFGEALALAQMIGDSTLQAKCTGNIGSAYLAVPGLRDLDEAERWYKCSLGQHPDRDRRGRATALSALATVALARFDDAVALQRSAGAAERSDDTHAADQARSARLKNLNDARDNYQQALNLTPPDDRRKQGDIEHQLGLVDARAGDTTQAQQHYQRAIQHHEAYGNLRAAGQARYNIAVTLVSAGQTSDALLYARAALKNFRQAGHAAADLVGPAQLLVAQLELLTPP